jgi:tetratricopeptide (TPR) repeat protein/transcriptional regulator with XRE-family HTH domain
VAEAPVTFASLLRKLRAEAMLTQEELAEASGVRPRSISDLERGVAVTPQRETVRRLADALQLTTLARAEFEAAARGRAVTTAAAMRTLPRDIASFTGRQQELRELMEAAATPGRVVGIHAIGGMAGIGKTAFAVHAAHRLADRFPAGQIFLPLHGHSPGRAPVSSGEALATLLLTIGVPTGQIPPDVAAREALWRDRLAERRLLLVLDDAADSEQLRPLLPGTGGSLVLITSRRHLSALDDAKTISLDTLPAAEATELLARLAARPGVNADDPAAGEIARLCGYLPLAIGMIARQLHHHPAWTLAGQAAELAAAVDRLELMATENLSVAAAFDLSYADLTPGQQRLFRRLGLHPGSELDARAAAALDGTGLAAARSAVTALYDQYLLTEPARGRYRMHDLIREHARILAERLDTDEDRSQATARLLDFYQHGATVAARLIGRQSRPGPTPDDGTIPAVVPALDDPDQALAWLRTERDNLLACLDHDTGDGHHTRVIALTAALAELMRRDGPWTDAIVRHAAAVRAGRLLADRLRLANALNDLGDVLWLTGDFPGATQALEESLSTYGDVGDELGRANALLELGLARRGTGDFDGAAQILGESLGIYRDVGDERGQANALLELGTTQRLTGDFPGAAEALGESLEIFRDIGSRLGQANALTNLGIVRRRIGDFLGAAQALTESLDIFRDIGSRLGQANALANLGVIGRLTGDLPAAADAAQEALGIYRDIGYRQGQANVASDLGVVRRLMGDFTGALSAAEEALGIFRDIGDMGGEAEALNEAGTLHRVRGDLTAAGTCHRLALDLSHKTGSPRDEAHALAGLARCALSAGRQSEAAAGLRQAQEIFERIGAAEAKEVSEELDGMTGEGPVDEVP